MNTDSDDPIRIAGSVRRDLAESGLPPSFAKLYSQHTLLRAGRRGLRRWRSNEADLRLHDAMRLTSAALLEKDEGIDGWDNGLRRAGEVLEWLAHSELNAGDLPIHLLASAAYQLAGFPARAVGLLEESEIDEDNSRILYELLKSDFRALFGRVVAYWQSRLSEPNQDEVRFRWEDEDLLSSQMQAWTSDETVRAFGVLCANMRWGGEDRLQEAVDKLLAVANLMLHSRDSYSWLLSRLSAEVVAVYVETSMRRVFSEIFGTVSTPGQRSFERYLRSSFMTSKAIAWPSQMRGIARLLDGSSFALCTPTGSGKTTVAEIGILQSLFSPSREQDNSSSEVPTPEPMAIYLVPSKALAAEVEAKLSVVLRRIGTEQVQVTSLYGGTDWGPTDAWLSSDQRLILICTYEKFEALVRFLGSAFLSRVALVVVDEAHSVRFDGSLERLENAESRPLRLESLGTRLSAHLEGSDCRLIALSAVAGDIEEALAGWITGDPTAEPVRTNYRSTRQLIGRLECLPNRRFEIRYDLLDGSNLRFMDEGQAEAPFVPNPFPPHPPAPSFATESAGKRIRPYLLWTAVSLAAPDRDGYRQSVLISVTAYIGGYAGDFLRLLRTWENENIPQFFEPPTDPEKIELWNRCLEACVDYFTTDSREYKLLEKGIIVHHGKMPGPLARLLVEVIQKRIVSLVLATSTLTQGVNLPFETVLIPSIMRWDGGYNAISAREFGNLVGRAGRPGYGTEGRSLVLMPSTFPGDTDRNAYRVAQTREDYVDLLGQLVSRHDSERDSSPLALLLRTLEARWQVVSGSSSRADFFLWLEHTIPSDPDDFLSNADEAAANMLDTVDSILLSMIVEVEELAQESLTPDELEAQLKRVWRHTYSFYASAEESRLGEIFVRRGRALATVIYPSSSYRRRLYRTSLPPRDGRQLIEMYDELHEHLELSVEYAQWSRERKLDYLESTIELIGEVRRFEPRPVDRRSKATWSDVLHWWLAPTTAPINPTETQISRWHDYISNVFQYRFNWGLGCFIALVMEETFGGLSAPPSLEEWPLTDLPWASFWIKEIITWGTLDPVAAYLLSRRFVITRPEAEELAADYYDAQSTGSPNDMLNAVSIRNWANELPKSREIPPAFGPPAEIRVELERNFSRVEQTTWRVLPVTVEDRVEWLDPAGFSLASSPLGVDWRDSYFEDFDFELDVTRQIVTSQPYL